MVIITVVIVVVVRKLGRVRTPSPLAVVRTTTLELVGCVSSAELLAGGGGAGVATEVELG